VDECTTLVAGVLAAQVGVALENAIMYVVVSQVPDVSEDIERALSLDEAGRLAGGLMRTSTRPTLNLSSSSSSSSSSSLEVPRSESCSDLGLSACCR
jgi:hypothetical protein